MSILADWEGLWGGAEFWSWSSLLALQCYSLTQKTGQEERGGSKAVDGLSHQFVQVAQLFCHKCGHFSIVINSLWFMLRFWYSQICICFEHRSGNQAKSRNICGPNLCLSLVICFCFRCFIADSNLEEDGYIFDNLKLHHNFHFVKWLCTDAHLKSSTLILLNIFVLGGVDYIL